VVTQRPTFTCAEAERAISQDLDGLLGGYDRHALRAHLHSCGACRWLEHTQRAQQSAMRALADVSLPSTLWSFDPNAHV
jgi:predicted anti-sigma-YlaC factor YlaD